MRTIKILLTFVIVQCFIYQIEAQRSITQLGPNYYIAGIPTDEFEYIAAEQECMNWCWATCIQMVLNYHGLFVNQQQIVQKIYGGLPCLTGNAQQIMNALTGWAPDVRGGFSQIYSQYGVWNGSDIVDQLSRKWPIVVGLQNPTGGGHTYVLTAIYYSVDQGNNPIIDKVVLRNPWPYSPSKEEMQWNVLMMRRPEFFKVWVNRL